MFTSRKAIDDQAAFSRFWERFEQGDKEIMQDQTELLKLEMLETWEKTGRQEYTDLFELVKCGIPS